MSGGWTAIVLAGSRPGGDPLARAFGTGLKALISVAGEPMVRRPVAALMASAEIGAIRVLAQDVDAIAHALPRDERVSVEPSRGSIADTLLALCADGATKWPLLITTADHALLTPEMVDQFCWRSERADVAIGVVNKKRVMRRLPETHRTWIPFRGGAYTGANLFVLRSAKSASVLRAWQSVEQDRKKVLKLMWSLGPEIFVRALLRTMTIDEAMHRVSARLGLSIRAIRLSDPLAAVDVDKVSDHQLVERLLAERG